MTRILQTDRLHLVMPAERHVAAHAAWTDSARAEALGWRQPVSLAWLEFASVLGHHALRGFGPLVAEDAKTGAALGLFGPWHPPAIPDIEIKWTLWSDAAVGKGLAFEAATAVRAHVQAALGLERLVSYIHPGNTRSAALARRLGAVADGTWQNPNGKIVDVWRHPVGVA